MLVDNPWKVKSNIFLFSECRVGLIVMCEVIMGYKYPFVITRYVFGLSFLAVFGLSLFHFGAPGVCGKTSVFLRLE